MRSPWAELCGSGDADHPLGWASGKVIPLLDNAYQGYASGELAKDGYSQQLTLDGRPAQRCETANGRTQLCVDRVAVEV